MRRAAIVLTALLIVAPAHAASFAILSFAGPTPIVTLEGPIQFNDDLRFAEFLQVLKGPAIVRLDSDGGNTYAALGIGRMIAHYGYGTYVGDQGLCASACGLIWLAGKPRMSSPLAHIGLHASYMRQDGVDVETSSGNALVGRYLGELGFGDEFVVYATAAAPNDMAWLNRSVTDHFGVSWELKSQDIATLITIDPSTSSSQPVRDPDSPSPLAPVVAQPQQPAFSPPKRVGTVVMRLDGSIVQNDQEKAKAAFIQRAIRAASDPAGDAPLLGRAKPVPKPLPPPLHPVEKAPRLLGGALPPDE